MDRRTFLKLRGYIHHANRRASRTEKYASLLILLEHRSFVMGDSLAIAMLYKNTPVYLWKYNDTLLRKAR